MFAKFIFIPPKQKLMKKTGGLFKQMAGTLLGTAIYSRKNSFSAACSQIAQIALRKAGEFTKKVPVPAVVKKHLSKKDMAFIAAAYAIPLPGTALFAAAIVASKRGCRYLRGRLKVSLALDASNG